MGGGRFVDITGIPESGISALKVTRVLDADGNSQERASIPFLRNSRMSGKKLGNTVGCSLCLESLSGEDVSNGTGGGLSVLAGVNDIGEGETEDVPLVGKRQGQGFA